MATATKKTEDDKPKVRTEPKDTRSSGADNHGQIYQCANGCGFSTRVPKQQALKVKLRDKNNIITGEKKEAEKPYLCPNCDSNGSSSNLVPFP